MSGTYNVVMGDRGRLVVPAELRERLALTAGVHLLLVESSSGVVLMTRGQARAQLRRDLAGIDMVGELLSERRAQAARDDSR